jgi:RNA polymerase sigma factor (sigma-70 family)
VSSNVNVHNVMVGIHERGDGRCLTRGSGTAFRISSSSGVVMRTTARNDATIVVAAQAGDRRALDELVAICLPLVYTIVRRALAGHPDVDDVVQDTMLRALRELHELRSPQSFRPWLAAIAVRQVSTYLHRRDLAAERMTTLDEVSDVPDVEAAFEGGAMLRLELSNQRRQVMRASRWLDPGDRALLSLWWLELAGQLSRTDLAVAMDVTVVHAGVRLQRMRQQLDVTRSLVAALDARPTCAQLKSTVADWDGRPSPLWRKRMVRHTRSCAICSRNSHTMLPAERLLVGFALLPVPIGLTAALIGKGAITGAAVSAIGASAGVSAGTKAGLIGQIVQALAAHPVIATVVAGAVATGAVVTTTTWPDPPPPRPTVITAPTSRIAAPALTAPPPPAPTSSPAIPARSLAAGKTSLESVNAVGLFVTTADGLSVLARVSTTSAATVRDQATFEVVPGLADRACFSFRTPDGRYLRHSSWRLRLNQNDGTPLFRGDATFCVRAGTVAGTVALESSNYPGWFLRHRGNELWVDHSDASAAFRADSSFRVRPALAS